MTQAAASSQSSQPQTAADIAPQPQVRSDRQPQPPRPINVGSAERKISMLGGSGLLLLGLARRSVPGLGLAALGGMLAYRGLSGHCSGYQAFGINTARRDEPTPAEKFMARGIHVECAETILRPAEELYRFWRDFANLPRFMQHLKAVEVIDEKRSRWIAKAPAGWSVQWEAEIINEEPNQLIAWRSIGGSDVENAGSVRFIPAPSGRGTEVRVVVDYIPPAGRLGVIVAKMFGEEPEQQIRDDLHRFKQLKEAGEIPTTEGQPHGTCGRGIVF